MNQSGMNAFWWIPIVAGCALLVIFVADAILQKRHVSRCLYCGARRGDSHRRGCQSEGPPP
jgi:hypothetical protein